MPASRNPFSVRTAEQAESDDQFLNLFSVTVLDLLPEDGSWNRFLSIESAPGSGKSTLLRLFTPTVLTSIVEGRNRRELRDLFQQLKKREVLSEKGVHLIGVLVNCKEDYNRLGDFQLDMTRERALFRALMHSRIALLTIRASLQLAGFSYPYDVDQLRYEPRDDGVNRRPDSRIINGRELFDRARTVEELIVNSLNSFVPRLPSEVYEVGFEDIFQLLNTHRAWIENSEVAKHTVLMFDDAHFLEGWQRQLLTAELERHDQSAFASWMAMRLRALDPPDLISDEAVRPGRERLNPMLVERWGQSQIEKWLIDVGDRRALRAERDVSSYDACLANSLQSEFSEACLANVAETERERTYELAKHYQPLYDEWLMQVTRLTEGNVPFVEAVRWAQLHILIERRIGKRQRELALEPLASMDFDKATTGTFEAAALFMCRRNRLPYFYGASTIAQLASANVEQFLSLSSVLFDRLLNSGKLAKRQTHHRHLLPSDQERVVLTESRAYVENLRTSLPYGEDVFNLVKAIAEIGKEESSRPNLPIMPGVTGVSIRISERDRIVEAASLDRDASRVVNALGSAIAHNALTVRFTHRRSDEDRAVLYLNRLVCPAFDLPLGYGGYKPQRLDRLFSWVTDIPSPGVRRLM